jgi:predicted PurR-regulated permease PerM
MALYPPAQPYQWTFGRVMAATLVLVFVALGFWLLYRFGQVVFILFIAVVMGTVIRPAVAWLHRRGLPRMVGVILVYTLLLALLIGFGLLLFPLIIEQGAIIAADVPGYYQSLREWTVNFPNQWVARLGGFLPITLSGQTSVQQTGEQMLDSADQVLGYAGSVAQLLLVIIAILLLAIHWTLDGPRIIRSLLSLLPTGQRERSRELLSTMETKVGAFVAGQTILCLIIGVMALIAYWLIGLPNFLVLAFIAGVMEAVPMVGPLLGAIPAALIALSISPIKLVWVVVASMVIQQLENNLLVPRVMRRAVGVNSFVSLLAIFAFGSLFGLAGAIMAIPLTAILQLLLEHFVFGPEAIEPEVTTGRDFASRLHYDAQDLAQDLRGQARLKKGGSDRSIKQTDQVLDEIEAITADLDVLLAQISGSGAP